MINRGVGGGSLNEITITSHVCALKLAMMHVSLEERNLL